MAEGSTHLCRCVAITIGFLFVVSLGLVIGAFTIDSIESLFSASEKGGSGAPTLAPGHKYTNIVVDIDGGDTINVTLANWYLRNTSFPTNTSFLTYVVMLHGFLESGNLAWMDVMRSMPTTWVYIIPDLKGSGGSSKPIDINAYSLQIMAADLRRVITTLIGTQTPYHLTGIDFGGTLALGYGHLHPSNLRTITTFNAHHPLALQGLLQSNAQQQNASAPYLLHFMSVTANAEYETLQLDSSTSSSNWWVSRKSLYRTMWSQPGCWDAILNYWRANILLQPDWTFLPDGTGFNAQTTVNLHVENATTNNRIQAVTRMYIGENSTYFALPIAFTSVSQYVQTSQWRPHQTIRSANHWMHHHPIYSLAVADHAKQAILNPN